ncbi:MAG TPA: hypothetical protein VFT30_03030 [Nitrospira sp.]|nr:hypothetical protein [Nitrospira sp.]
MNITMPFWAWSLFIIAIFLVAMMFLFMVDRYVKIYAELGVLDHQNTVLKDGPTCYVWIGDMRVGEMFFRFNEIPASRRHFMVDELPMSLNIERFGDGPEVLYLLGPQHGRNPEAIRLFFGLDNPRKMVIP